MRTDVFRSRTNRPQFAGISAGSNAGRAVSAAGRGAIAPILAAGLWALPTRSWRRTELHVKNRDDRPGSNRQTEHRVLAGPLGRSIAQASDADAARQSSFDGSLHELGREERERDRHIDLSNAAFVAGSNLLDTGHGASNNLIKPTPAARDRCDECGAGLGANRSTVVRRHESRHDDIASPFHWRLLPWDTQDKSIIVHRVRRIAGCLLCLQLDRQLIRLDLNSDDVVADEVSASTFCVIPEMLADGASDESLHIRRRHPAHRSDTPRLSVQEG